MSFDNVGTGVVGWGASNKENLNECLSGGWWVIAISGASAPKANFNKQVSNGECGALTSSWDVANISVEGGCNGHLGECYQECYSNHLNQNEANANGSAHSCQNRCSNQCK